MNAINDGTDPDEIRPFHTGRAAGAHKVRRRHPARDAHLLDPAAPLPRGPAVRASDGALPRGDAADCGRSAPRPHHRRPGQGARSDAARAGSSEIPCELKAPSAQVDFSRFCMATYTNIVVYKTAFYTFYLPIACAMLLSGYRDPALFAKVRGPAESTPRSSRSATTHDARRMHLSASAPLHRRARFACSWASTSRQLACVVFEALATPCTPSAKSAHTPQDCTAPPSEHQSKGTLSWNPKRLAVGAR